MKANYQTDGLLIVVSGPSGVGKGTVCAVLRKEMPELIYSVSATTRAPRAGEEHGANYFFKTVPEFEKMIAENELIEWARYVDNYYGTPRQFVEETLQAGKDILLEIDVQGALQVKERFPQGIFIFLLPPTLEDLRHRIIGRGSETESSLQHRLSAASGEYEQLHHYDYVVINDQVADACNAIRSIITAEHCRTGRLILE